MSIVEKRIGKSIYKYEVVWDKENKKQKWIYLDKLIPDNQITDIPFSKQEITQIKYAYAISEQHNYTIPKNTLKMICDRLNIEL